MRARRGDHIDLPRAPVPTATLPPNQVSSSHRAGDHPGRQHLSVGQFQRGLRVLVVAIVETLRHSRAR